MNWSKIEDIPVYKEKVWLKACNGCTFVGIPALIHDELWRKIIEWAPYEKEKNLPH